MAYHGNETPSSNTSFAKMTHAFIDQPTWKHLLSLSKLSSIEILRKSRDIQSKINFLNEILSDKEYYSFFYTNKKFDDLETIEYGVDVSQYGIVEALTLNIDRDENDFNMEFYDSYFKSLISFCEKIKSTNDLKKWFYGYESGINDLYFHATHLSDKSLYFKKFVSEFNSNYKCALLSIMNCRGFDAPLKIIKKLDDTEIELLLRDLIDMELKCNNNIDKFNEFMDHFDIFRPLEIFRFIHFYNYGDLEKDLKSLRLFIDCIFQGKITEEKFTFAIAAINELIQPDECHPDSMNKFMLIDYISSKFKYINENDEIKINSINHLGYEFIINYLKKSISTYCHSAVKFFDKKLVKKIIRMSNDRYELQNSLFFSLYEPIDFSVFDDRSKSITRDFELMKIELVRLGIKHPKNSNLTIIDNLASHYTYENWFSKNLLTDYILSVEDLNNIDFDFMREDEKFYEFEAIYKSRKGMNSAEDVLRELL